VCEIEKGEDVGRKGGGQTGKLQVTPPWGSRSALKVQTFKKEDSSLHCRKKEGERLNVRKELQRGGRWKEKKRRYLSFPVRTVKSGLTYRLKRSIDLG